MNGFLVVAYTSRDGDFRGVLYQDIPMSFWKNESVARSAASEVTLEKCQETAKRLFLYEPKVLIAVRLVRFKDNLADGTLILSLGEEDGK